MWFPSAPTTMAALLALMVTGGAFILSVILARSRAPGESGGTRSRLSSGGIALQAIGMFIVGFGDTRLIAHYGPLQIAAVSAVLLCGGSAVLLFLTARRAMGANWSLVARTRDDHELVTSGPFAHVRHPIYAGMALFLIALAVALGHEANLLAGLPLFVAGTMIRVVEEERLLRAHFGAAYDVYAAQVARFVPKLF